MIVRSDYLIKVTISNKENYVTGWIDFNGNKTFNANEQLFSFFCKDGNTEYSQTFTIPHESISGTYRFRLRTKYGSASDACEGNHFGQTHDYTIIIPEVFHKVQNVTAAFNGSQITVNWDEPNGQAPIGYNIYRAGKSLNTSPLTATSFMEQNITDGIYFYNVTAVYANDHESLPVISNIICNGYSPPQLCEKPFNLLHTVIENKVIMSWNKPNFIDGLLLGYNLYRNNTKIATLPKTVAEYCDENLASGIYLYKVSAIYEHCDESEFTNEMSVRITNVDIPTFSVPFFKIYPNPAFHSVTIEGNGLARVEIYDIQGRHLADYNCVNGKLQMNVNNYENGIYFVKLLSDTGEVSVKRLVVIK